MYVYVTDVVLIHRGVVGLVRPVNISETLIDLV
jgi:hypothetical protein